MSLLILVTVTYIEAIAVATLIASDSVPLGHAIAAGLIIGDPNTVCAVVKFED